MGSNKACTNKLTQVHDWVGEHTTSSKQSPVHGQAGKKNKVKPPFWLHDQEVHALWHYCQTCQAHTLTFLPYSQGLLSMVLPVLPHSPGGRRRPRRRRPAPFFMLRMFSGVGRMRPPL